MQLCKVQCVQLQARCEQCTLYINLNALQLQGVKLCAANMQLSKQTRPACPSSKHLSNDLTMMMMVTQIIMMTRRMMMVMTRKMMMVTQMGEAPFTYH